MEQKLQSLGISSDNFKDCVSNADQACKDQIISNLEQQVEEQVWLKYLNFSVHSYQWY